MTQTAKCKGVATSIWQVPGEIIVQYHNTKVVDYNFNRGSIILNTGGWKTATTKLRMNQAANHFGMHYSIFQKNHAWFVTWRGETLPFDGDTIELK